MLIKTKERVNEKIKEQEKVKEKSKQKEIEQEDEDYERTPWGDAENRRNGY